MNELSGIERRITLRLLSYWERLRRERAMPSEEDIDPEDIGDLWDNCFLVHVADLQKADYNYTYLGQSIIEAYHHGMIKGDSGDMISPNTDKFARHFARVLDSSKPLMEEGEFFNMAQKTVKYRQCLLPIGHDGNIEAIFGGMSFKIFD